METGHIASTTPADVNDPRLSRLREVTGQVVGSVFYGTLLRTMRDSAIKGQYGHGGYGETVFQGQLDQVLAERAGSGPQNDLAGAMVQRLAKQQVRIETAKGVAQAGGARE